MTLKHDQGDATITQNQRKSESMLDKDIYDLATDVLTAITRDLSEGIYAKLGGTLSFSWSTDNRVSAWAESNGEIYSPPKHNIVFCYELARRLYRDCENYHDFAATMFFQEPFQTILKIYDPWSKLPNHIDSEGRISNMYFGALTWVYFHELGHLMQEHGHIRSLFGYKGLQTFIEDCEADGNTKLTGRDAVISHVTELAADVEAIQWCTQELTRHFFSKQKEVDEFSKKEFQDNLYLFVCGISCALYRFSGERYVAPEASPEGSHPSPLRRLNQCLPNLYEKLDFNGHGQKLHGLNRTQLVHLSLGAANSVGLFWFWIYGKQSDIPEYFLAGAGIIHDPFRATYWQPIVRAWDEIKPEIKKIRRFGNELGILYFTDYALSSIFQES